MSAFWHGAPALHTGLAQEAPGWIHVSLTGFSFGASCSTSGAIQPSVPGMPERRLKLCRPPCSFLQRPKSEMTARICPWGFGTEMRMLQGFRSRWAGRESTWCHPPKPLSEDRTEPGCSVPTLTDAEGVEMSQPRHGLVQQRHRVQATAVEAGAFHVLEPHRGRKR